jgi:hypothetical protein
MAGKAASGTPHNIWLANLYSRLLRPAPVLVMLELSRVLGGRLVSYVNRKIYYKYIFPSIFPLLLNPSILNNYTTTPTYKRTNLLKAKRLDYQLTRARVPNRKNPDLDYLGK